MPRDDACYLGNDLSGFAHANDGAHGNFISLHEAGIVQRRASYVGAGQTDWVEDGDRDNLSRPARLPLDLFDGRCGLLLAEFPSDLAFEGQSSQR